MAKVVFVDVSFCLSASLERKIANDYGRR